MLIFNKKTEKIIKSHWIILLSLFFAILFGIYFPAQADKYSFIGNIYISLLQVSIIPLMISSVICSLITLINSHNLTEVLKKIFLIIFCFSLLTVVSSLFFWFIIKPGFNPSQDVFVLINDV